MWNCDTINPTGEILYRTINKYNLIIHNADTQSHLGNNLQKNSNLDLISKRDIVHFLTAHQLEDTYGSDHYPIEFTFNTEKFIYRKKRPTNFPPLKLTGTQNNKKQIWTHFYTHFLSSDFSTMSPVDRYNYFVSNMLGTTTANTPSIPNKIQTSNPVTWWDAECSPAIRCRKAFLKKMDAHLQHGWLDPLQETGRNS